MQPDELSPVLLVCLLAALVSITRSIPQIKPAPDIKPVDLEDLQALLQGKNVQELLQGLRDAGDADKLSAAEGAPVEGTAEVEVAKKNVTYVLTGDPQIDYIHDPNLPAELNGYNMSDYPFFKYPPPVEVTNFTCDDRYDGFYASPQHKCQVYHNCLFGIRYDFLCPNYTAFDQTNLICHYANRVDCDDSSRYFDRNKLLYVDPTTTTAAPIIKFVYVDRPSRRKPGNRGGNRRPPPPQEEEFYYDDYVDETPPKSVGAPQKLDAEYDYYYDDATTTTTTTKRPPLPRRQRPQRPARPQRKRLPGKRRQFIRPTEPEQPLYDDYVDFPDDPPPARRTQIRNPGVVEVGAQERRKGLPQKKRRRKKRTTTTTTTTTTTVAPTAAEDDYYYEYYYDDDPDTVITTTTTRAPLRRLKRPRLQKSKKAPRVIPSAAERKKALQATRDSNPNFPGLLQEKVVDENSRDKQPVDIEPLQSNPTVSEVNSPSGRDREEPVVVVSVPSELLEESVFANSDKVIIENSEGSSRRRSGGGRGRGQASQIRGNAT